MTDPHVYHPLSDLAEPGRLPLGDLLDEVLEHVWLAAPDYDAATNEGIIGVLVDQEIAVSLPGVSAVQLALGSAAGEVDFELRARLAPHRHSASRSPSRCGSTARSSVPSSPAPTNRTHRENTWTSRSAP